MKYLVIALLCSACYPGSVLELDPGKITEYQLFQGWYEVELTLVEEDCNFLSLYNGTHFYYCLPETEDRPPCFEFVETLPNYHAFMVGGYTALSIDGITYIYSTDRDNYHIEAMLLVYPQSETTFEMEFELLISTSLGGCRDISTAKGVYIPEE